MDSPKYTILVEANGDGTIDLTVDGHKIENLSGVRVTAGRQGFNVSSDRLHILQDMVDQQLRMGLVYDNGEQDSRSQPRLGQYL